MSRFERSVEMLHDLLLIQQERATVYEKFIQYPGQEISVCSMLQKIAIQSRNCMIELRRHIDMSCGDPADRVEVKGDIYRNWPGIHYFLPNSTPGEVYINCEQNERETIIAYQKAIAADEICQSLRELLYDQLKVLRTSFRQLNECKEKPMAPVHAHIEERTPFSFTRSLVAEAS